MFKKIKFILYNLGIIDLNKIDDMVAYLLNNEVNMHNANILELKLVTVRKDIIEYIELIDKLIKQNILDVYLDRRYLTINYDRIFYYSWYTDNSTILTGDTMFKVFLSSYIELKQLHTEAKLKLGEGVGYSNSIKLEPYIINIENIIKDVFKNK